MNATIRMRSCLSLVCSTPGNGRRVQECFRLAFIAQRNVIDHLLPMQGTRKKRGRPARIKPMQSEPMQTAVDGIDSALEPAIIRRRRGRPAKGAPSGRRRLRALLLSRHIGIGSAKPPLSVRLASANYAIDRSVVMKITPPPATVKAMQRSRMQVASATNTSLAQRPRGSCLRSASSCVTDATRPLPNAASLVNQLALELPSCVESKGSVPSQVLWGNSEAACALEPQGGNGSALSVVVSEWLSEWQRSLQAWWLLNPFRDGLKGCLGALGLHLAQRLKFWQQSVQGAPGPPPPLKTTRG